MVSEKVSKLKGVLALISRIFLFLSLFSLVSCQAAIYGTADDFANVSLGMSKQEVIAVLGNPVSVGADADSGEEQLIYKRMKHAISAWARTYEVVLRDGKVVRFGEQYEETGSTPILRTLQRSLIMGKRSVYVEEKKVQPPVQARCG